MTMRSWMHIVGMTLSLALFPGWSSAAPAAKKEPVKVTVGVGTNLLITIGNWTTDGTTTAMLENLYDALFTRDLKTSKPMPNLAEKLERLDAKTYRLTLKRNIKFHNGDPLTAEDVKFTFEYILNPASKSQYRDRISPIASMEVNNPQTLTIKTSTPWPIIDERLLELAPLPKKYAESIGWDQFKKQPVGVGPYKFVSFTPDQSFVLKANPDYWKGAPTIDEVEFRIIPEFGARLAALLSSEVDIVQDIPPNAIARVNQSQSAKVISIESARINYIALVNFKEGSPFADKRVRQAMNYAVDIPTIIKTVMQGHATQLATVMPRSCPCFVSDLKPYPYNPGKAKALLKEAGFEPSKLKLTLETTSGRYPNDKEAAEAIAAQLNQLGMQVQVKALEYGQHLDNIRNRRSAEMFLLGWGSAFEPERVISQVIRSKGPYSGFRLPEVDKRVDDAAAMTDPVKRQETFVQIQRELYDLAPWIFMWVQHDTWGISKRVDFTPNPDQRIRLFEARVLPGK